MIWREKIYYVYIMASISRVLYVGYTDSIIKRGFQHKTGFFENAFTKKYRINKLVYFETKNSKEMSLIREKQIKGLLRKKKIQMIEESNPNWEDLYKVIMSLYQVK
ncbi:MAG: GIY-YIG nuclease family protein [Candidatus Magasanikiibacteriota bacterium]